MGPSNAMAEPNALDSMTGIALFAGISHCVGAHMSTRVGGVSAAPWSSLNLGVAVGDAPQAVAINRQRFVASLDPAAPRPVWLRQVHGTTVLELKADTAAHPELPADAAWTAERGLACIIQVADCLPVLFAARDGRAVAAAHAGWRGLAGGVLERTVEALCQGAHLAPEELLAWVGPGIGPAHFEVGRDVLLALGLDATVRTGCNDENNDHTASMNNAAGAGPHAWHRYAPRADGSARWKLDLAGLAAQRLRSLGIRADHLSVSPDCTYTLAEHYFSYRRDGITGRMAAAIWRRDGAPALRRLPPGTARA
jgi:polyphenol oxidase